MFLKTKEKRRFPRIRLRAPLHYQIRGRPDFNSSISENISLGGIGFINDKYIAPLTNLMLKINILSRVLYPIGRIAWVSPLVHTDRYRLGIEFLELDPNEKNFLAQYIDMQIGQS